MKVRAFKIRIMARYAAIDYVVSEPKRCDRLYSRQIPVSWAVKAVRTAKLRKNPIPGLDSVSETGYSGYIEYFIWSLK